MAERLDVGGRGVRLREHLPSGHSQVPQQHEDPALGARHARHRLLDRQGPRPAHRRLRPPYETYEVYTPTFWEVSIGLGIFAVGALVVTLLWKIAIEMKREGGEPFELAE